MTAEVSATPGPVVCSYCFWRLTEAAGEQVTCLECGSRYHADCIQENGSCATFGCPDWMAAQSEGEAWAGDPAPAVPAQPASWRPDETPRQFCTGCGTPLNPGNRFCTTCGEAAR